MMQASIAASNHNRKSFHSLPNLNIDRKNPIPVSRRARKVVPLTRAWLRGVDYEFR
jgi:hypothetical protein